MTIRWALIGTGRHAERSVVPELRRAAGTELVAVVSRALLRGESFARAHAIPKTYEAVEDALADPDIDAIYDATPDGLHARHAVAAAAAGKHVLVEKPLATSVADGAAAIEACRRHGVLLGVVFNQRHEAVHQAVRRMVRDGAIGELKLAEVEIALQSALPRGAGAARTWRTDPTLRRGGIIVSIGDHAHDTLSYITGQSIEAVTAMTDATMADPPNERVAAMLLELSQGAIGHAVASYATPFARRPFAIHGTTGSLIIENSYVYLTGADADPTPTLTLVNASGRSTRRFAASDCFRLEVEQFNRAIAGTGAPMTPARDALRALAVGEALYAAVKTGRTMRVADFMTAAA